VIVRFADIGGIDHPYLNYLFKINNYIFASIKHNKIISLYFNFQLLLLCNVINVYTHCVQGCGITMPDSSDSYIEPSGQVDFPS